VPYQRTDSRWELVSARLAIEGSIIADRASLRPAIENPRPAFALLREERRAKEAAGKNLGREHIFLPHIVVPLVPQARRQTTLSS
jgi:hypothetical protein